MLCYIKRKVSKRKNLLLIETVFPAHYLRIYQAERLVNKNTDFRSEIR